jgi:hypothetical protein
MRLRPDLIDYQTSRVSRKGLILLHSIGRSTVISFAAFRDASCTFHLQSSSPAFCIAPERYYTQWVAFGLKGSVDDTCGDIENVGIGKDHASKSGACCLLLAMDAVSRQVPEREGSSRPTWNDTTAVTRSSIGDELTSTRIAYPSNRH